MNVVDVGVIGGGPAGLAAAMWAARYQRTVVLIDAGEQRNRRVASTHGYLGMDGATPGELLARGLLEVERYPEIDIHLRRRVTGVDRRTDAFDVRLDNHDVVRALRLVLATGVRDELPSIEGLDECFGRSVFTCPSCDGYEARNAHVVVLSTGEHVAALAVTMLDWAKSVTALAPAHSDALDTQPQRLRDVGVRVITGAPAALIADRGRLRAVRLASGEEIPCDVAFLATAHRQRSELPAQLGCAISEEGCVLVDEHGLTSVDNVFAAGDMTPGPHLVQVAAAKGAVAGIAAAMSLRGTHGAPTSPVPAPDPETAVH